MTEINLESLKGMYDRYPEEQRSFRWMMDIVEETAREFGFNELGTPSVERADLYRVKSGEELMDQMYNFKDKGGREISLIPEQTPTRARLIQKRKDLKSPIKWFDTSKRWRYEDVQRGRDREFFQTDFDIFGVDSVEADAEIIAAAAKCFEKMGLQDRVEFKINDRQILQGFLEAKDVPEPEKVMKIIDDEEKMSRDEFLEQLEEIGLKQEEIESVDDIVGIRGDFRQELGRLKKIAPKEIESRVERMEKLADALDAYGVLDICNLDLSIVRGLAYYTGLVFEAFDSEGKLRALFGGGRYDDLVGLFGGREVPAVGFAFGYSPTKELLVEEDRWPVQLPETDIYILTVSDSVRQKGIEYATKLREYGLKVETDLKSRGFGSQLDYADSLDAKRVLIVGERDLEKGKVTMKHMDSGDEEELDQDKVLEHLKEEGF